MKKIFPFLVFGIILTLFLFPAPAGAAGPSYSSNWAGYVAAATSRSNLFTSVSADWKVPGVSGPDSSFSGVWVGIGGAYRNSSKLIQAGTEQDVAADGTASYRAWYEIYPKSMVDVGTVSTGDVISVSISKNEGKPETWNITITDSTVNKTLINQNFKVKPNFASQASADFIVERPLLVVGHQTASLADFRTVTFNDCTTSQGGLDGLNTQEIVMTSDGTSTGTVLASPEDTLSSDSFTVTAYP